MKRRINRNESLLPLETEEGTLLQQAQNLLDDARNSDLYQSFIMIYKLYFKNVVEKILKNDTIVELINSSKNREGIYKLIKSYSELGDKSLKLGKWTISANSIGKKIDSFNKGLSFLLPTTTIKQTVTEFVKNSNVYKTLSKNAWLGESAKFLGKASTFAVGKATEKAVSNIVGGASKMFSGFFGG